MTTVDGPRARAAARSLAHAAFRDAVREGLTRTETLQKDVAAAVGKSAVDISRYLTTPHRLPRNWDLVEGILLAAGADVDSFRSEHGGYWGVNADLNQERLERSTPNDPAQPSADPDTAPRPITPPDACPNPGPLGATATVPSISPELGTRPSAASASAPSDGCTNDFVDEQLENSRDTIGTRQPISQGYPTTAETDLGRAIPDHVEPKVYEMKTSGSPSPRRTRQIVLTSVVLALFVCGVATAATADSSVDPRPPAPTVTTPPTVATTWPATVTIFGARLHQSASKDPTTVTGPQLDAGTEVTIECGETGDRVVGTAYEQSTTWLRRLDGLYLSATVVDFAGPVQIPNCVRGEGPVPVHPRPGG